MFASSVNDYDLFMFIEDDNCINDEKFFEKAMCFYQTFGEGVILSPNRYEFWERLDAAWKVYLEGEAPPSMRVAADLDWKPELSLHGDYGSVTLTLAKNPMSGCFVITRDQVKRWMKWPDFQRPDPVLAARMDIMEIVQVPLSGRLPIYKPASPNQSFFEVHHLPNRASKMKTPSQNLRAIADEEIASKRRL